jgi:exodeoxyribonuclease VII large subunit
MDLEINNSIKQDKIYTVSEITRLVKLELESTFPLIHVEGEISNFFRHHSGHLYFTLKDENCQLRAVMFRSEARQVPFSLENGLQVICRGRINVYEPRGEYQILVEKMDPKGKGSLQLAFEQLKEKLKKEGLFEDSIKKKLPLLPKKIGVVTSPRGAAIIDILRTIDRRFAQLHILIYPVRVQGKGAAQEIVEGIEYFGQLPGIDVIIAGRGGGSIEDLWAFNEEIVARAIFRCPVPVISAVGHEVDFTIADFVADIRASTPSAAAEMVVEKEQSILDKIENLEKRNKHNINYTLQEYKLNISDLINHQVFRNFRDMLYNLEQKVDELETRAWDVIKKKQQKIQEMRARTVLLDERILNRLRMTLQTYEGRWERLSAELHNLSPLSVLKKGYTLCWKDGGRQLIKKIDEVSKNQKIMVSFFRGEFTCSVEDIKKDKYVESKMKTDFNG